MTSATYDRIASERVARGLPVTDARRVLITLAIEAGYSFAQIGAMLRSGRGDEGHSTRVAPDDDGQPFTPGSETLADWAMRHA